MKLFGFLRKVQRMNVFVLLVCFILSYVLIIALFSVKEWDTSGINTYFHHRFNLPDGTTAAIGKFDDCVKFSTNSEEWEVEKLYYQGDFSSIETVHVGDTLGMWRIRGPIGDFSVSVKRRGESQPYFLDVRRDSIGNWSTGISRW